MDNSDGQFFKILSPTKVWLSPDARAWAQEFGMTDEEMARHLLSQSQSDGENGQLSMTDPVSTATNTNPQIQPQLAGPPPMVNQLGYGAIAASPPLQQQAPGPSPMANQLGYGAIGQAPPQPQQPNFLPQQGNPPRTLGF
jgi:hypothetical protein